MKPFFRELAQEIYDVSYPLFKLMIPIIILVKVLEELGGVALLGQWLEPIMSWVGLPESMGLVWATTILTNMYAGMVLFATYAQQESMTVAQVTVIGCMMLMAHGLPVEGGIARKAGVYWWYTLVLRIGGGLLLGWLLHVIYGAGGWLQMPNELAWQPELSTDNSLWAWVQGQLESLVMIQVIIIALLFVLKVLKLLGIERLIALMLRPILRLLGIGKEATTITIVGMTLGLAFGGGLLIKEAQAGEVSARDVFTAMTLIGLVHSMIEDTILILLLGADIHAVIWGRLLFGLVITALISYLLHFTTESMRQRYLYEHVAKSKS